MNASSEMEEKQSHPLESEDLPVEEAEEIQEEGKEEVSEEVSEEVNEESEEEAVSERSPLALILLDMGYTELQIHRVLQLNITNPDEAVDFILRVDSSGCSSCPICETTLTQSNEVIVVECAHCFCRPCLEQYLQIKIEESQVLTIMCPMDSCRSELDSKFITSLITPELADKYTRFLRVEKLSANPNLRWCPKPDCEGYDIGSMRKTRLVCNTCSHGYCYYCSENWEKRHTCKQKNDFKLDKWSKMNGIKLCPNCKRRVQKTLGCDHMTCPKCKYEWCWLCGAKYYVGHFDNCEYKKFQKKNPPWHIILGFLFAPVLFPFTLILIGIYGVEGIINEGGNRFLDKLVRIRCISYPIVFVLGILFIPIAALITPFVFSISFMHEWVRAYSLSGYIFEGVIGVLLAPFTIVVGAIAILVLHLLGIYFVALKVYVAIRKCKDPTYMAFTSYANF